MLEHVSYKSSTGRIHTIVLGVLEQSQNIIADDDTAPAIAY